MKENEPMTPREHDRAPARPRDLNDYSAEVHEANAKWWKRADGTPIENNRGELLMLIVSEVAEAMEGERKGLMDDKLPHRRMAEVELADVMIRVFDYAGAYGYDLEGAYREKLAYNARRADHKREAEVRANGDGGLSKPVAVAAALASPPSRPQPERTWCAECGHPKVSHVSGTGVCAWDEACDCQAWEPLDEENGACVNVAPTPPVTPPPGGGYETGRRAVDLLSTEQDPAPPQGGRTKPISKPPVTPGLVTCDRDEKPHRDAGLGMCRNPRPVEPVPAPEQAPREEPPEPWKPVRARAARKEWEHPCGACLSLWHDGYFFYNAKTDAAWLGPEVTKCFPTMEAALAAFTAHQRASSVPPGTPAAPPCCEHPADAHGFDGCGECNCTRPRGECAAVAEGEQEPEHTCDGGCVEYGCSDLAAFVERQCAEHGVPAPAPECKPESGLDLEGPGFKCVRDGEGAYLRVDDAHGFTLLRSDDADHAFTFYDRVVKHFNRCADVATSALVSEVRRLRARLEEDGREALEEELGEILPMYVSDDGEDDEFSAVERAEAVVADLKRERAAREAAEQKYAALSETNQRQIEVTLKEFRRAEAAEKARDRYKQAAINAQAQAEDEQARYKAERDAALASIGTLVDDARRKALDSAMEAAERVLRPWQQRGAVVAEIRKLLASLPASPPPPVPTLCKVCVVGDCSKACEKCGGVSKCSLECACSDARAKGAVVRRDLLAPPVPAEASPEVPRATFTTNAPVDLDTFAQLVSLYRLNSKFGDAALSMDLLLSFIQEHGAEIVALARRGASAKSSASPAPEPLVIRAYCPGCATYRKQDEGVPPSLRPPFGEAPSPALPELAGTLAARLFAERGNDAALYNLAAEVRDRLNGKAASPSPSPAPALSPVCSAYDAEYHRAPLRRKAAAALDDAKAALMKLRQLAKEHGLGDHIHTYSKAQMFLVDAVERLEKLAKVAVPAPTQGEARPARLVVAPDSACPSDEKGLHYWSDGVCGECGAKAEERTQAPQTPAPRPHWGLYGKRTGVQIGCTTRTAPDADSEFDARPLAVEDCKVCEDRFPAARKQGDAAPEARAKEGT